MSSFVAMSSGKLSSHVMTGPYSKIRIVVGNALTGNGLGLSRSPLDSYPSLNQSTSVAMLCGASPEPGLNILYGRLTYELDGNVLFEDPDELIRTRKLALAKCLFSVERGTKYLPPRMVSIRSRFICGMSPRADQSVRRDVVIVV